MALGTPTVVSLNAGQGPVFYDSLQFVGDGAYPAGGTAAFTAFVNTAVGATRTVIAVLNGQSGDRIISFVPASDKLFVRVGSTGVEQSGSDAATTYNLIVISE